MAGILAPKLHAELVGFSAAKLKNRDTECTEEPFLSSVSSLSLSSTNVDRLLKGNAVAFGLPLNDYVLLYY